MNELQPANYYTGYQNSDPGTDATLGDLVSSLRRRKRLVILVLVLTIAAAAGVSFLMHPMWKSEVQFIVLQRPTGGKSVEDPNYTAPLPDTPDTEVAMLSSSSMVQRVEQWYENEFVQTGQQIPAEVANPAELTKNITIDNPKDSNLITLDVEAPSRDQSMDIANNFALQFVQWKKELAQQDIQSTLHTLGGSDGLGDIDGQVVDAKKAMDVAISAEFAYRNTHHLVNVDAQEAGSLALLQNDEASVTAAQEELSSQQAALATLKRQLGSINHSFLAGDGGVRDEQFVQNLQLQLSQAQIARDQEAQQVTPLYPGKLPVMDAQIADLKRRLDAAIKSTVNNGMPSLANQGTLLATYNQEQVTVSLDQQKLASAAAALNQQESGLSSMPQYDTTITRLDRDVQTATLVYNTLEAALNTARLQINTTNGNVQITQAAVGSNLPDKPNWIMNLALGTVLGLLFGLFTVLRLEQADKRVYDVTQVERFRLGTVLGAVPTLRRKAIASVAEGRTNPILSEQFSVLRTNLLAILAQTYTGSGQIVLVTSAAKGEGKSTVLAELARTLADAGKKIIVVDANLRNPALDQYFATDQEEGLSDVVLEQTALDDVIATENPYLSVLHSGTPSDEPTRLVSTPPFVNLLQLLRARADIVLIDSSSAETADPLLMAPYVDYVLQVVGTNKSKEKSVIGVLSALSAVSRVGIVVNHSDLKTLSPYQLVNAASKSIFAGQTTALTHSSAPLHLTSPDSENGSKPPRIPGKSDIKQIPVATGEKQ